MKNSLLSIILFGLFSLPVSAQIDFSNLDWGGRIGINYASIQGDASDDLDIRIGGLYGLFVRYNIGSGFLYQQEFNYSAKGATRRLDIEDQTTDFTISFDYLEMPVILKYDFNSGLLDKVKKAVYAGPFLAIKLSSDIALDETTGVPAQEIQNTSGLDYGFVIGAELGLKVENVDLLLELRYNYSIPSFDDGGVEVSGIRFNDLNNGKNRVFSIAIGFVVN